jgi:hypothetical protein
MSRYCLDATEAMQRRERPQIAKNIAAQGSFAQIAPRITQSFDMG